MKIDGVEIKDPALYKRGRMFTEVAIKTHGYKMAKETIEREIESTLDYNDFDRGAESVLKEHEV